MEEWNGDELIATWIERAVRESLDKRAARRPLPRVAHARQIALIKTLAYYDELNLRPSFAAAFTWLFEHWSPRGAEQFSEAWPLPPEGTKDLLWSYNLWARHQLGKPLLVPSSRPFPAMPSTAELAIQRGYRVRPPRSGSATDLERGAGRLAARVVDGKPWSEIADEEVGKRYPRDTRAIRTQVANFARELHIALPERKAGRPPKARNT